MGHDGGPGPVQEQANARARFRAQADQAPCQGVGLGIELTVRPRARALPDRHRVRTKPDLGREQVRNRRVARIRPSCAHAAGDPRVAIFGAQERQASDWRVGRGASGLQKPPQRSEPARKTFRIEDSGRPGRRDPVLRRSPFHAEIQAVRRPPIARQLDQDALPSTRDRSCGLDLRLNRVAESAPGRIVRDLRLQLDALLRVAPADAETHPRCPGVAMEDGARRGAERRQHRGGGRTPQIRRREKPLRQHTCRRSGPCRKSVLRSLGDAQRTFSGHRRLHALGLEITDL
jgi:hypothetical protein